MDRTIPPGLAGEPLCRISRRWCNPVLECDQHVNSTHQHITRDNSDINQIIWFNCLRKLLLDNQRLDVNSSETGKSYRNIAQRIWFCIWCSPTLKIYFSLKPLKSSMRVTGLQAIPHYHIGRPAGLPVSLA